MRSTFFTALALVSLAVVFFASSVSSAPTACPNGRWECSASSDDWNYVDCVAGVCQCFSEQGFIGTAQPTDKCRCDKKVFWENGNAYCVDLKSSAKLKNAIAGLDFNGDMTKRLDWFAGGSYTISGTYQFSTGTFTALYPAKLAVDAVNKKIFFDHVTNIHWLWPETNQVVNNNIYFASIFVVQGRSTPCYLSNFTTNNQVSFHNNDVYIGTSINYQSLPVKQYLGKSFDHHVAEASLAGDSSQRIASYTEQTYDGIITAWSWDNIYPLNGALSRFPQSAVFNISTLVRGTPDQSLWNFPASFCRSGNTYWYSEISRPPAQQVPLF